jgi:hypothetical protein
VLLPRLSFDLFAIGGLRGHGHLLPVAAEQERERRSRRRLAQHPADLLLAIDGLAVHAQDDVVLAQARLAGRSIVVHQDDLRAARLLQLQRRELVLGHVAHIDAEIALPSACRRRTRAAQEEEPNSATWLGRRAAGMGALRRGSRSRQQYQSVSQSPLHRRSPRTSHLEPRTSNLVPTVCPPFPPALAC